ncbi:MAG: DMT family transporter [Gammaproteobacteria bacterium]|nr:DMT family transporter [Gammaproteobacteria bacterium]MCI0590655.1 DMT family transporter [Gammaproteobacteria bacterium]
MHSDHPHRGIGFALAAALSFAGVGATVKIASGSLSNEMIVFLRNLFGLLALFPWLYHTGISTLATRRFTHHLVRTLFGLAAMYCFFYAIARLQLAEAVLFNFSAPLFIPIIALVWLGERVPRQLGAAIVAGFLGISLILKPGFGLFSDAAVIGLASGIFAAIAMVSIRRLSDTEPTSRIVFYFAMICTVVSAIPLIWGWQTPALGALAIMAVGGALATVGQLFLTHSYALAPAAQIGPYTYATVIFAAAIGWAIWGEVPDRFTILGAILVCIAGILALRLGQKRGEAKPITVHE